MRRLQLNDYEYSIQFTLISCGGLIAVIYAAEYDMLGDV